MMIYDRVEALVRKSSGTPLHGDMLALRDALVKPVTGRARLRSSASQRILEAVSASFEVRIELMCGPSHEPVATLARHVAIYCLRECAGLSTSRAAAALGRKDHTTAMHATKRIARLRECDLEFSAAIEALMAEIRMAA